MGLKILMAIDFYPPFIGGAERQTQILAEQLVSQGHEVHVATVWHRGLPSCRNDDGVTVHSLRGLATLVPWFSSDAKRRFHPPWPDPYTAWQLRKLVRRVQPDLVHASGWIAYSCAAALVGTKVPLLTSVRDYGYTCAKRTMLHNDAACTGPAPVKCLQCASHTYGALKATAAVAGVFTCKPLLRRKLRGVHSISTYVQMTVRRDFFNRRRSGAVSNEKWIPDVIIPGLLDHESDDSKSNDHLHTLPDAPYILFVGALQPHKGLGILLESYAQLTAPPPLVLIGSIWADSPHTFPAGVTVINNVPHGAVMTSWQRCLFGVVPSVWPEPLGGVVREGMSAGKAVIGTATGGIPDMIEDGKTGLLVPPGDVSALVDAMRRLIDDRTLRERLGVSARIATASYAPGKLVPRFEALYREITRTTPGGPG